MSEIREKIALSEVMEVGDDCEDFTNDVKHLIGSATSHLDGAKSMIKRMQIYKQ